MQIRMDGTHDISLSQDEESTLIDCYDSAPAQVGGRVRTPENLAYTPEMGELTTAFNTVTGRSLTVRETFLCLNAVRKAGRLPRKPR